MRSRTVARNVSFIISLLVILSGVERPKGQKEKIKKKAHKPTSSLVSRVDFRPRWLPLLKEKIAEKNAKVKMNNAKLQCKMSISSFVA